MYSQRQNKISKLIQKEIADILIKEGTPFTLDGMVTVTVARISSDLSIARIYLSIFPSSKAETIIENINAKSDQIRFIFGKRTRNQLKKIPELRFFYDDSQDYAENIDRLLK